jgi:hypothetical protein
VASWSKKLTASFEGAYNRFQVSGKRDPERPALERAVEQAIDDRMREYDDSRADAQRAVYAEARQSAKYYGFPAWWFATPNPGKARARKPPKPRAPRVTAADVAAVDKAMAEVPGAARYLATVARRLSKLGAGYKDKHWGQKGTRAARALPMPDVSGGVEILGSLVEISYLTTKGGDAEPTVYFHAFDGPFPILGVAPDGKRQGLVVLRDRSRYTVNTRGIVG